MKTKIYLLACIIIASITFSIPTYANQYEMSFSDIGEGGGTGGTGGVRSNSISLSAVIEEGEYINTSFQSNIGIVAVSIVNNLGCTVYSRSVNTASTKMLFIDIFDLTEGSYTINFIEQQGSESKYAQFTIK